MSRHGGKRVFRAAGLLTSLLLLFASSFESLVVLHFALNRRAIEREICVMRDATPKANTCHGNCYLMRKLRAVENNEQHPMAQIEVRLDPAVEPAGPEPGGVHPSLRIDEVVVPGSDVLDGIWPVTEPVPWC